MRRDAAFLIAIALAMPLAGASPGVYATIVKYDESDAAVWLDIAPVGTPQLVYFDAGGLDGKFDVGADVLILHLGTSTTIIETGDLILSGTGSGGAGSRVTSSHIGATFSTSTESTPVIDLVKYKDVNGDSTLSREDRLYLDLDDDDAPDINTIRLLGTLAAPDGFGSHIDSTGDADYTTSTELADASLDLATMVRLIDITGNGASADDPVYLDLDQNKLVTPRDIRWSAYRGHAAGLFPAWSDADVVSKLTTLGSPTFLKETTTGQILLDLDTTNDKSVGDLRLTPVGSCALGTLIQAADACDGTTFSTESGTLQYVNEGSGFTSAVTIYAHFTTTSTEVAVGDLRILKWDFSTPNKDAGTKVTSVISSENPDFGQPLTTVPLSLAYLDADGNGVISAGDAIYLDGGVEGVVDPGDVRISKLGSLATAAFVGVADADSEPTLKTTPGSDDLVYIEQDGGTGFHISDPVILRTRTTGGNVDQLDLRISAGPGGAAGTFIANGASEDGDPGLAAGLQFAFYDLDSSVGLTLGDFVYASQKTTDVETKDVRVTSVAFGSGSFAKGSRVATSHSDSDLALTAVDGVVRYQDRNGDGALDSGDRIYLNLADSAETTAVGMALITPADVRLSGTGGTTTQGVGTSTSAPTSAPTTSTTTTTTTTTTATTTGTTTGTTTTTPPITLQTIASWNRNIQDSLTIERTPEGNLLSWDEQHGPLGFQVFRSDSPFAEITQLGAGATSYLDPEGALDSAYLVTAFYSGGLGFIADANTEDIPGLGVAPEGKTVGGKQAVPGLGVVLIAVVLAGLVVLRRRL